MNDEGKLPSIENFLVIACVVFTVCIGNTGA